MYLATVLLRGRIMAGKKSYPVSLQGTCIKTHSLKLTGFDFFIEELLQIVLAHVGLMNCVVLRYQFTW